MSVDSVYDTEAFAYDSRYKMPVHAVEDMVVEAAIRSIYEPGMSVLDVGCGTGHAIKMIDFPVEDYTGIDPSKSMLSVAVQRHPKHVFEKVSFEGHVCTSMYDVVLAIYGQVNYMGLDSFVQNISRLCRGEFLAILYSGVANPDCEYTVNYQKIYSPKQIRDAFAGSGIPVEVRGFSVTSTQPFSTVIDMLAFHSSAVAVVEDSSAAKST